MSNMSNGLMEVLGIGGTPPNLDNPEDEDFDGFKDETRPESKFEMIVVPSLVPDMVNTDAKTDYIHARNHTYTLLGMTTQALARALDVAKETEHPRAFESFNSLASTARMLTQDLLSFQKLFKDVVKGRPEADPTAPPPGQTNVQINGNVTTQGSTNLIDLLKEAIASGEITPLIEDGGEKNG